MATEASDSTTDTAGEIGTDTLSDIHALIERCRTTCLWSAPIDFLPTDPAACRLALASIERHGDRAAFVEARRLARCL